jgi:hypothetical protein
VNYILFAKRNAYQGKCIDPSRGRKKHGLSRDDNQGCRDKNSCARFAWGFFRRRSGFFREADHQFCDPDQESERSDAGEVIVAEVIGIVK